MPNSLLVSSDQKLMQLRKKAAIQSLKFFKDIKPVRSTNNPFDSVTAEELESFGDAREYWDFTGSSSITNSFDYSAETGVGNCDEKGRICYASLCSSPLLIDNSEIMMCSDNNEDGYDHIFIVIADRYLFEPARIDQLGKTVMIVDGWTEDWYFPNLSAPEAVTAGLINPPNPRQLYVRNKVKNLTLQSRYIPI